MLEVFVGDLIDRNVPGVRHRVDRAGEEMKPLNPDIRNRRRVETIEPGLSLDEMVGGTVAVWRPDGKLAVVVEPFAGRIERAGNAEQIKLVAIDGVSYFAFRRK